MTEPALVALGAAAPLARLQRVLGRTCPDVKLIAAPGLRRAFPSTDNVVLLSVAADSGLVPSYGADGLVSHRHTPTGKLRRIVAEAASTFGAVRLLVRHGAPSYATAGARSQRTTLTSFLRSGRVVQEDTLLSIVQPRIERSANPASRSRARPAAATS